MNPTLVPSALMITSAVCCLLYWSRSLCSRWQVSLSRWNPHVWPFHPPRSRPGQQLLYQAHLYIGLAIFCGFIMFDTQVIIRKARNGDKDFIAHSLDLFIDFVQIFRKVLILLMQKDERDNKNKRR